MQRSKGPAGARVLPLVGYRAACQSQQPPELRQDGAAVYIFMF
jgi:hypothetical protein